MSAAWKTTSVCTPVSLQCNGDVEMPTDCRGTNGLSEKKAYANSREEKPTGLESTKNHNRKIAAIFMSQP